MNVKNRKLALDVGDKRIGIAVSDELGITARGLFVLERISDKKDTEAIMRLIGDEDIGAVIIGLPLGLDGKDTLQTEKVRNFTIKLENKLKSNSMQDIQVVLHDERFTTKIAEDVLREASMSRKKRKDIIDAQAAVVILQDYMETQRNTN